MTTPTTSDVLATAREHLAEIKRRAPTSDARIRLLLGGMLEILVAQQAEIQQLRTDLQRVSDGPTSPFANDVPWLGSQLTQAEPASCG